MFGTSTNEMVDSGGATPDPNEVAMRPAPSFGENLVSNAVSGAMGHGSEIGANILSGREIQNQYDAVRKYDPSFADTLSNPGLTGLPDIKNGMSSNAPVIGKFSSKYGNVGSDNTTLGSAIESQRQIQKWKTSHPEAEDVPDVDTMMGNVKRQQDIVDQEAAEANERASGVNIPGLGKVTGSEFLGSMAASFAPSNPTQAIFNVALGAGGISKDLIAGTGQRIAANAAANGVVSAISQSVLAAPTAAQYGVQRDYKQEAFGVLTNTLLGGVLSGVHEGVSSYFPATTPKGMGEVKGSVDEIKGQPGPIGDVVKDLAAARNPDELQAKVAALPLETRLDVLHEVSPNPSAEERGVINAGEKDLVIEKGAQEAGMEYPEAAQHAVEVSKAIEASQPIPETPIRGEEKLPPNLSGAKPRWGYQERNGTFRDRIKGMAKDSPSGDLTVEKSENTVTPEALQPAASSATQPEKSAQPKAAPAGPKYPVRAWLKRQGGVRTGSALADELNNMGINTKTAPGLFRTLGRMTDVDNIPHSEWDLSVAPKDETGHYVDRQHILDAIDSEQKGRPITREHIEEKTSNIEPGSKEDLEQYAHSIGVDTEGKSVEEALNEIKQQEARLAEVKDEVDTVGMREEEREDADKEMDIKYQAIEQKIAPVEKTEAGEQSVIPGAEKISDKQLAERGMEGGKKSTKPQKAADEGLFDVAGRAQEDMFSNLKPKDAAPISDEKEMTVKDAIDEIHDHENLMKAMTTCSIE